MNKEHYLFCPGPVMVSEKVHRAALHDDICHRVPVFEKVIQNLKNNLLKVYKADEKYAILLITGSGTAANETVISSYFSPGQEALLINNGEFGCRLEEILSIHDVKSNVLTYEWGRGPDLSEIEDHLKNNKNINAIVMVFHETSTNYINPVKEVGELAKRYGKTYIVDAVSALGGENLDVVRDHIDFCTCSANKCIASLPGVGLICAKILKLEEIKNNKQRTAYLNLNKLYNVSKNFNQTPNTPSTTMFLTLDAAVQELIDEGIEGRIKRYKRCAGIIREGVRKMGMKLLVDDKDSSNTVTSVFLPEEIDLNTFIQRMEDKGYTIYPGKRHLKERNLFQISNMGQFMKTCVRSF